MTPLTTEQAKEMKPLDMVRYFNPDLTDQECEDILWEETCFPFGFYDMINHIVNQLNEYFIK